MGVSCFAYQENSGKIDLDSIAETEDGVRLKCLEGSMGWRFNYPDRYDQDVEWARLLTFGQVVPVMVVPRELGGEPVRCNKCGYDGNYHCVCSPEELDLWHKVQDRDAKILQLVRASVRAFDELNDIRARDGVPYCRDGRRSDVCQEYFSSVVDGLDEAVIAATGKSAHCHPELYTGGSEVSDEASD